ncbi:MAG TPA: iron transporter [Alphaproteobacteria bacterium]|jgi:uncharacterized protein involved in high-affinity Fe2+ transport|nr:iron transporter [Alphaproteobacteria bacterium]
MNRLIMLLAASLLVLATPADAREYFVGGPVKEHDMEIVANYLVGVQMAPMSQTMDGMMEHGSADMIHLEADIHATADSPYGYADGSWIPYLTVSYVLKKADSDWVLSGKLMPMTAKDGPHYANNITMNGPGTYQLTYVIDPPAPETFGRHIDKQTGVPDWWKPVTVNFSFKYPQK